MPDLEDFLTKRDYLGAIALLSFRRHANRNDVKNLEWLAYCYFHFGEHDKVNQGHRPGHVPSRASPPSTTEPTLPCNSTSPHRTQALAIYKELLTHDDYDPMHFIFAAACHYYMGMFKEAEEMAQQVCTVASPTGWVIK